MGKNGPKRFDAARTLLTAYVVPTLARRVPLVELNEIRLTIDPYWMTVVLSQASTDA